MYFLVILVIEVAAIVLLYTLNYYYRNYLNKHFSPRKIFFIAHGIILVFIEFIFFGYQIGLWWGLPQ